MRALDTWLLPLRSGRRASPAAAQAPDRAGALAPAFAEIDRVFTDYARDGHVPGMAWGVIVDGRLVHTGDVRRPGHRRLRRR